MSKAPSAEVMRQLHAANILPHADAWHEHIDDCCVRFTLSQSGITQLSEDPNFASGALSALHADVGKHRMDFRAYSGTFGRGSLQVVVDRVTGNAYADVDAFNPYQDVVGFLGHAFGEVVPGWFKKKHKGDHDA